MILTFAFCYYNLCAARGKFDAFEWIIMNYDENANGIILEAGHGTMRDGPGWRSIIYFKGCNFRCKWCGSPDTISAAPGVLFFPERIKYPGRLIASCPYGALRLERGAGKIDRSVCASCRTRDCAAACIDCAIEASGREATVGQLVAEVLPYKRAHRDYGVTLSGGEPTLQWNFFIELLKAFRHHGLHTAVETNGSSPQLPESFPLLDLMICDLKLVDPAAHKKWTGRSNRIVLGNIRAAAESGVRLWIRIPVVPGVNDGENIDASIAFLLPIRDRLEIELLGYHKLGVYKWKAAGMKYTLGDVEPPAPDAISEIETKFVRAGFKLVAS